MKYLILTSLVFCLGACASLAPSAESLESAPNCQAWKDSLMGMKNIVKVEGETADYEHSCGITGCSHVYANYKDGNDIYTSNSGLLTLETKMAKFDGKKFFLDSSVVNTEPFEVSGGKANYTAIVLGKSQDSTIHYNKVCTARQAALGVAVLFSK